MISTTHSTHRKNRHRRTEEKNVLISFSFHFRKINGLLREYFLKGTDFAEVSEEEIARVEYALNTRPRK